MTVSSDSRGRGVLAEVQMHNGCTRLMLDGKPHNGMMLAAYGPTDGMFGDFARAGVELFEVVVTPTAAAYGVCKPTWLGPDQYDYSQLEERVSVITRANPGAHILLRINLGTPKWWADQYPDELVKADMGGGRIQDFHQDMIPSFDRYGSYASEPWRRDTKEGIRRMLRHIEAQPYGDRVVGYHLACGGTEELFFWGSCEMVYTDYSTPNVKRFRAWLKERYKTTDALAKAWNWPGVQWENPGIPAKYERDTAPYARLRMPELNQGVLDYLLYQSDLTVDTMAEFAAFIKEETGRRKVVGCYYGYYLQLCGEFRQQNAGHLALDRLLRNPDIDMVMSCMDGAHRHTGGEGTSYLYTPIRSVRLHGKYMIAENDTQTSMSPIKGEYKGGCVDDDILNQSRVLGHALTYGTGAWWFDVCGNRYNEPPLMEHIAKMVRAADRALDYDRTPVDEFAFVVDGAQARYLADGDKMGYWLVTGQLPEVRRIGAPVGDFDGEDLEQIRHKVVYLPVTLAPTPEERRRIDALKCDGRILIFTYAAGLFRDGHTDEDGIEALTGVRVRAQRMPMKLVTTLRGGHPLSGGCEGVNCGAHFFTMPAFLPEDDKAIVLGTLDDGRPSFVAKEHGTWTSVYCSTPTVPRQLLHAIAKHAGVHLYIDTPDVVHATRELVSVSVVKPGKRTIRLPRRVAAVRDLVTGDVLAENVSSFEADFAARDTRTFSVRC